MIKILNSDQIRAADAYTIVHEPIASLDLMERAAGAFCDWLVPILKEGNSITIVCGTGNNGGDGLAIARILLSKNIIVDSYIIGDPSAGSEDFKANLRRLEKIEISLKYLMRESEISADLFTSADILIDGLFGSGLSRPLSGIYEKIIKVMNSFGGMKLAIDIASGLFSDKPMNPTWSAFQPDVTVSFELPKLAFFRPENEPYVGTWNTVSIGLDQQFLARESVRYAIIESSDIFAKIPSRKKFSHKGTYGHTLLIAGSRGKMGAAILAASACLRAGVGLLTIYCPGCGRDILQIAVPEAMVITDPNHDRLTTLPDLEKYSAIAIGPGIGTHEDTQQLFVSVLSKVRQPLVIDADGINILASIPGGVGLLLPQTILTPHPKEFFRLMNSLKEEAHPWDALALIAKEYKLNIVLKGANSLVCDSMGFSTFNSTGNAGMATGGSGDVLTGIIVALLSQKYSGADALRVGVYLHGLAADLALEDQSEESLVAGDIVAYLGAAFQLVKAKKT